MTKKTFRDSNYYRYVVVGKRTVKEGECAALWGHDGQRRIVHGPKLVRLLLAHVRFLDRHVADQNQYLLVQFRSGRKECIRGPVALFFDPCEHLQIKTMPAYKLSSNEAIVVFREDETPHVANQGVAPQKDSPHVHLPPNTVLGLRLAPAGAPGKVTRRIVRGPAVFVPHATEWVQQFSWHGCVGADGKGSITGTCGDEKMPHAVNFSKLRFMPDQTYYSVRDVRTVDDALLSIHLMLFYELANIEQMLDYTNDPIGDFINATSADVIAFGAKNTYQSLLQTASELNDVRTFPILNQRMEQTGFRLHKVVYRGYTTSPQLQSMHEESISKRTKLKLAADTKEMEQQGQAMELKCKAERRDAENAMEEIEMRHRVKLDELQAEQKRKELDDAHTQKLRHEEEMFKFKLERDKLENDEMLRRVSSLKGMGVDLTKYLCTLGQSVPDKHVRVETLGSDNQQLHFKMPNLL